MPGTPSSTKRQAVILIHGMGEQVPMETIRGFAETIWARDPDISGANGSNQTKPEDALHYVPDPRTGSSDLRRISTPSISIGDTDTNLYTHFFELYWADVTRDNRWKDFTAWYRRLVIRRWSEVPDGPKYIWIFLWMINATIVLAALKPVVGYVHHHMPAALPTFKWSVAGLVIAALGYLCSTKLKPLFNCRVEHWLYIAGILLIVLGILPDILDLAAAIVDCGVRTYPKATIIVATLLGLTLLVVPVLLVKYFGDVPRYTLPLPSNVAVRKEIQDRALTLLRDLSAATPAYERIIVVGHSLGSIIAYDLVCLAWSEYRSATNRNPRLVPTVTTEAMKAAHKALKDVIEAQPFNLAAFRTAQRAFARALQAEDKERAIIAKTTSGTLASWLITDLVTIGSPLTHSTFLLAPTKADFFERRRRRELSTCPPMADRGVNTDVAGTKQWGITYKAEVRGVEYKRLAYDAAFAAVRWSNLHDRPKTAWSFLIGDIFSGPVGKLFGCFDANRGKTIQGVWDCGVKPMHIPPGLMPPRFFTHNEYWSDAAVGAPSPEWIVSLRKAVNIWDKPEDPNLRSGACREPGHARERGGKTERIKSV